MEQVAGDLEGIGAVAMINIDENRAASQEYGIRGIPSLLVLKDGEVLGEIRPRSREQIAEEFKELL